MEAGGFPASCAAAKPLIVLSAKEGHPLGESLEKPENDVPRNVGPPSSALSPAKSETYKSSVRQTSRSEKQAKEFTHACDPAM